VRREGWLRWRWERHIFGKEHPQCNETPFLLIGKVWETFWRELTTVCCENFRISRILQQFLFNLQVALVVKMYFLSFLKK
jgi:hypothetical protein